MRIEATSCRIGSSGDVPANRCSMHRSVELTLANAPRWGGVERGMIESKIAAVVEMSAADARLLGRALIAEAKIVEGARR